MRLPLSFKRFRQLLFVTTYHRTNQPVVKKPLSLAAVFMRFRSH